MFENVEGTFDDNSAETVPSGLTISGLITAYKSDPDSTYRKLRFGTRQHYDDTLRLIEQDYGHIELSELRARTFLRWHEGWTSGGRIATGHLKVGLLRTIFGFGATILENPEAARIKGVLSGMKFQMPKPREERLTADQAIAIRKAAHELRRPSIALAQSLQFEGMMRQRDILGEWVPLEEPGISDVIHTDKQGRDWKWIRGLRWEEVDDNLVLRHVTSKRQKPLTLNLRNAPMVLEEFALLPYRPRSGPIVISEFDCLPWTNAEFRRLWRVCANMAGVPKTVRNMDSRAGAITEASEAGAAIEHIKHAATHSQVQMTERYSRGAEGKIEAVQLARLEHRQKQSAVT